MYKLVRTSADSQAQAPVPARAPVWRRRDFYLDENIRLAVFEAGPGDALAPRILFVHGLGHWTQAAWNAVAAALESTHHIVAFDLPGFGASSKPDVRYDLRFFRAALHAIADATGGPGFALAGHSLGGLIAADFAGSYPSAVDSLTLIDPAGFLRTPHLLLRIVASRPVSSLFRMRPSYGFVHAQLRRSVYDAHSLDPAIVRQAYELALDPDMRRAFSRVYSDSLRTFLDLPSLHARFARHKGSTAILWGREDRYIPIRALANARRVYPHAEVTTLERCGHCPNIEYPQTIAERLSRYYPPRR